MESKNLSQDMVAIAKMRLDRYDQLVRLALEQQTILVSGNSFGLTDNLAKFDHVVLELKHIDNREGLLIAQFNRKNDAELVNNCNDEYESITRNITEKAYQLRELISINTKLLTNAIGLVKFSMDLLCKISAPLAAESGSFGQSLVFDARV